MAKHKKASVLLGVIFFFSSIQSSRVKNQKEKTKTPKLTPLTLSIVVFAALTPGAQVYATHDGTDADVNDALRSVRGFPMRRSPTQEGSMSKRKQMSQTLLPRTRPTW